MPLGRNGAGSDPRADQGGGDGLMKQNRMKQEPSAAARALAWGPAFLLCLLLTLLAASLLVWRVTASPGLHEEIALNDAVQRQQEEHLEERIGVLAAIYGFDEAPVLDMLRGKNLRDLNRQAVSWWTRVAQDGTVEEIPSPDTETLTELLILDEGFQAQHPAETLGETATEAAGKIARVFLREALPVRTELIEPGLKKVQEWIDLPEAAALAHRLSAVLALFCVLLAGFIALLLSRRLRDCLRWLGAAMGAAALLSAAGLGLWRILNVRGIVEEANLPLAEQIRRLEGTLLPQAAAEILLLAGGAALCFLLLRKPGGKAGQDGGMK